MNTKFSNTFISKGFIIAGLSNILGVLIFSKLFTNPAIEIFNPQVMSNFGLVMIMLWGFVYITISKSFNTVKWLVFILAIEKFVYAINWSYWFTNNKISQVFEKDTLAGIFYVIYGLNDWLFFFFFLLVFFKINNVSKNN